MGGPQGWRHGSVVRAHAAFADDCNWVPSNHIEWLTVACSSSFRGSCDLFWSPQKSAFTCTHSYTDRHIIKIKYNLEN